MADSFSNSVKSSTIDFNAKTLLDNNSDWTISKGTGTLGSTITLNGNSACTITLGSNTLKRKVRYLKILANITCSDKTLSTDNEHNLAVSYIITLNSNKVVSEVFYPKFDFENLYIDKIVDDFSVIGINDEIIKNMDITIYNYYDIPIQIKQTGLYYCSAPTTPEAVNVQITQQIYDESYMQDVFNNWLASVEKGENPLVIPLRSSLPNINSVPDGFICRIG